MEKVARVKFQCQSSQATANDCFLLGSSHLIRLIGKQVEATTNRSCPEGGCCLKQPVPGNRHLRRRELTTAFADAVLWHPLFPCAFEFTIRRCCHLALAMRHVVLELTHVHCTTGELVLTVATPLTICKLTNVSTGCHPCTEQT